MRFQPRQGRLLAAAAENVVSIYDVESETCVHTLQVFFLSVCWVLLVSQSKLMRMQRSTKAFTE